MADSIYLSLWFPSFSLPEMLPRALGVMKHFPFSEQRPGIGYVGVHAVSFNEPVIFQETFDFRADPEHAVRIASEFLHDDNAYEFEALWDLWVPTSDDDPRWIVRPQPVTFLVHGLRFDDGLYQQHGHVQLDLGLDLPFAAEEIDLTPEAQARIRQNLQKLVAFSSRVEKDCGISGRVLWSESEDETLAQKLLAKLQVKH
jgi:hypothetical protein